ncbi:hypothetical protein ACFQ2B_06470 [Streptomyces stramineus]
MSEFSVADDWHTSAAAATGSSTSSVEDVFVPEHRVVGFGDAIFNTTAGRANPTEGGRFYGLFTFVMAECAATFIGLARGAYELFLDRVPGRGITYTSWTDQTQHPLTQIQVATAANKIAAAEGSPPAGSTSCRSAPTPASSRPWTRRPSCAARPPTPSSWPRKPSRGSTTRAAPP